MSGPLVNAQREMSTRDDIYLEILVDGKRYRIIHCLPSYDSDRLRNRKSNSFGHIEKQEQI